MSEVLPVVDDPDPLSGFFPKEGLPTMKASETLLAEMELAEYEREAIYRLSMYADEVLEVYDTSGDIEDLWANDENVTLRRILQSGEFGPDEQTTAVYFYIDKTPEEEFYFSWTRQGSRVIPSDGVESDETTDDILAKLEQDFPLVEVARFKRLKLDWLLAKLLRR